MRIRTALAALWLCATLPQVARAEGLGYGNPMAAGRPHNLVTEVFFRGGFHGGFLRGGFRNHVMGRFGGGGGFRGGGGYGWGGAAIGAAAGVGIGAAAGAAAGSAYQANPYPYGYAYSDE